MTRQELEQRGRELAEQASQASSVSEVQEVFRTVNRSRFTSLRNAFRQRLNGLTREQA